MSLRSQRLQYERIEPRHAPELQEALCDPRVYECITGHETPTADDLLQAFTRKAAGAPASRSDEVWIDLAVRSVESGVAMGRIEATILEGQAEIAYLLGARHWGQGHACEAVRWLEHYLKSEFGVTDLWATVSSRNERSLKLLHLLGYAEAPPKSWPEKLVTHQPGDRVFHREVRRVSDV